jgi:hypothetical protein
MGVLLSQKGGTMATIEKRTTQDGTTTWRVKVRRKGAVPLSATFHRLTAADKWAQVTEDTVLEGRHCKNSAAKSTLSVP